jgi:outer membrane PBP1 activator LpoA protein
MKYAMLIPVLLASMILAACGKGNDNDDAPKLFESQRAMLDQAKNVGNTLQQQADEQKKDLDQQSQ